MVRMGFLLVRSTYNVRTVRSNALPELFWLKCPEVNRASKLQNEALQLQLLASARLL